MRNIILPALMMCSSLLTNAQQNFGAIEDFHIENATFFGSTTIQDASKASFGSSSNVVFRNNLNSPSGVIQSPGKFTFANTTERSINAIIEVDDLEVTPGSAVQILSNKAVTVSNQLTNSGTFNVRNDAALVQTVGSGLANSGTFNVDRDIPALSGFRYIGSPINNHPVSGFGVTPSGPNGGQIIPLSDCNPDSIDFASPYGNILELRQGASPLFNCTQSLWHVKSSGTLTNGRGYAMNTTGGQTLTFTGTVNNGPVSYANLGRASGTLNQPGGAQTRGWHIVSNPYPSPIFFSGADLTALGFDAQIHIFQTTGAYKGTWITPDPLGTYEIAVGQAFQIRKTNVGGASTFTVSNGMRGIGAPTFYKSNNRDQFINITFNDGFESDETMVYFYPNATDSFDPELDANRLLGSWNTAHVFTLTDNLWMRYNAIADLNPGEHKTLPLGIHTLNNGNQNLTFSDISTFNSIGVDVTLEDLKLNTFTQLYDGYVYDFIKNPSDVSNRFVLHFNKTDIISNVNDANNVAVQMFPNPATEKITLIFSGNHNYDRLFISDVTGKIVSQQFINGNDKQLNVDVSTLAAGLYTVNLSGTTNKLFKLIKQ
jgi:hypothetical protein